MQLFIFEFPLVWGELDLPLLGVDSDWFGAPLAPPQGYSLAVDPTHLWFVASREAPAKSSPDAAPLTFTPGLWHHDVAELFIADPTSGQYLELNLAANGAWWAAKFSSIRTPADDEPDFMRHITTRREDGIPNAWVAAMVIPIAFLKETINFGLESTANAAFILNSPVQTFHSAHKLGGGIPDFHRPQDFPRLSPRKLPCI